MQVIRDWYRRHFYDPQVTILALLLVAGLAVIVLFGNMLAPVLAAVIVAYLLEGLVESLQRCHLPRLAAVTIVFLAFLAFAFFALLGLLPLLSNQITQLVQQLPAMINQGQGVLMRLPEHYPNIFSEEQVRQLIEAARSEVGQLGQYLVSVSVASVLSLITLAVYVVLVPVLVFFLLKDRHRILQWFAGYLPRDRALTVQVWQEVNEQIANYVRGKFWEILIVGGVAYIAFAFFRLDFAILLAVSVGLSVIIPYVGAIVVTLPIALVAFSQWGLTPDFFYLIATYVVIQMMDGYVLVPVLYSEAVDLHPIAIIVAILVFGGIWGFWGVFFAIPLATVVQAVLKAWPTHEEAAPAPHESPAEVYAGAQEGGDRAEQAEK